MEAAVLKLITDLLAYISPSERQTFLTERNHIQTMSKGSPKSAIKRSAKHRFKIMNWERVLKAGVATNTRQTMTLQVIPANETKTPNTQSKIPGING
jgi:hypothetical protein